MKVKLIINKLSLFTIVLLNIFFLNAQNIKNDINVIKKINSTNYTFKNFIFDDKTLIREVKPIKKYIYWELNTFSHGRIFENILRLNDSIVSKKIILSKTNKGIGSFCNPSSCSWYISTRNKKKKISTIDTFEELKKFIGQVDNIYEACLLLSCVTESNPIYFYGKYTEVENGYLIELPQKKSNCIDCSDKTFISCLVTLNGEIFKIK